MKRRQQASTRPKKGASTRKSQYRIRNWHDYNESLVQRGSITLWTSEEDIRAWKPDGPRKRGGQVQYSDGAIQCLLMVRNLAVDAWGFLPYVEPVRHAEGEGFRGVACPWTTPRHCMSCAGVMEVMEVMVFSIVLHPLGNARFRVSSIHEWGISWYQYSCNKAVLH